MALTAHQHKMTRLHSGPPKELYCEVEGCGYTEPVPDRPESHLPPTPPQARERPGAPQTPGAPKPTAPTGPRKHAQSPPVIQARMDDDDL